MATLKGLWAMYYYKKLSQKRFPKITNDLTTSIQYRVKESSSY